MNDKEIMKLLKQNDDNGYIMLVREYSAYIATIVYNIAAPFLNVEDMEELSGDILFKIWNNRMDIHGDYLKGFIGTVARNTTINALKVNRLPTIPIELDELHLPSSDLTHSTYEQKEQMEIVNRSVKTFPEPDREIFIRFYYFGEKLNKISGDLSINLSTVKTKLSRCKKRIKASLHEGGYEYE